MIEGNPSAERRNPEKPGLRSSDVHASMLKHGFVEIPDGTEVTYSFLTKHADGNFKPTEVSGTLPTPIEGILNASAVKQDPQTGAIIASFYPDSARRRELMRDGTHLEKEITADEMLQDAVGGEFDGAVYEKIAQSQAIKVEILDLDNQLALQTIAPVRDKLAEIGAEGYPVLGVRIEVPLVDETETAFHELDFYKDK